MRIKDTPKVKEITRTCVICGKDIAIKVRPSGRYTGGHYFVSPIQSRKSPEYWECDTCFKSW